jgi:CRISPR-associated protein Csb1
MTALGDRLTAAANLESDDGAIRIRATYEPGGGAGTKVSPPTYPAAASGDRKTMYVTEERWGADGELHKTVLLDSRQSQANRCEESLERAIAAGHLNLPYLALETSVGGQPLRITSLSAPHRSRDAYFRDAETLEGMPFDATEVGGAMARATALDATPYFRHSPADLIYGVWDSHRDLRFATKFPRVYTSEVVGWDFEEGRRAAGRFDPMTSGAEQVVGGNTDWQNSGSAKKAKLSNLGLGMIPPNFSSVGGVTTRSIERVATLSFAGLARIQVGEHEAQRRAARGTLAALALLGDRLAFGDAGLFLRSGCDLVASSEHLEWVGRRGTTPLELTRSATLELFVEAVTAAEKAGLSWSPEPIRLRPQKKLQWAFDKAYRTAPDEGE